MAVLSAQSLRVAPLQPSWGYPMKRVVILSLVCLGCTAPNPDFVGGVGGGAGDPGPPDAATADLAGSVAHDAGVATPDLATLCASGPRSCSDAPATTSTVCAGGAYHADRLCPGGGDSSAPRCDRGYCQAPAGSPNCGFPAPSEDFCYTQVSSSQTCTPFIDPQSKMASWSCAPVVGNGASGDACTTGADCRSGFCGPNGTCFRACVTAADCPPGPGPPLRCVKMSLAIEGVAVPVRSCVP